MSTLTHHSTPFEPLGLDAIIAIGPDCVKIVADGLIEQKDHARLSALLPHLNLSETRGYDDRIAINDSFCSKLLAVSRGSMTDELIGRFALLTESIEASWRTSAGSSSDASQAYIDLKNRCASDIDFGVTATHIGLLAIQAHHDQDPESFRAHATQLASLIANSKLALRRQHHRSRIPEESGITDAFSDIDDLCSAVFYDSDLLHTSAVSFLIAQRGEWAPLRALLSRDDSQAFIRNILSPDEDSESREKDFLILNKPLFWHAAADTGLTILQPHGPGTSYIPVSSPLLRVMIDSSDQGDLDKGSSPRAIEIARAWAGEDFFTLAVMGQNVDQIDVLQKAINLTANDANLEPSFTRFLKFILNPKLHDPYTRASALYYCLFRDEPHIVDMALKAFSDAQPKVALAKRSIQACYAFFHEHRHTHGLIYRMINSANAQAIEHGLDALGLEAALAHPGSAHAKEPSLLMEFADSRNPQAFKTAVEWFEKKGALREAASSKAWVHQGRDTRKIGDLLAFCVAKGLTEHAAILTKALPDIDMKYARDTAKALAQKAYGEVGSTALSAFEDLLFAKITKVAAPTPRKARSL